MDGSLRTAPEPTLVRPASRARRRAALRRRGLRAPRRDARGRPAGGPGLLRGRAGRHPPGPARARRRRRPDPPAPRRPRHRRPAPLLRPPRPARPTRPHYVGRVSVTDAEQDPLVVDWRAPVAEPFYRATAVEPMGVVRRRHFLTRPADGRVLVGLDDEVFDADAADGRRSSSVIGRGRAARGARPGPHRPDGRHRRHDPGRAGRGDPSGAAGRARRDRRCRAPARRPSRCTAPRTSSTRTGSRLEAGGVLLVGSEHDLPALHRPGAPVARRGRRAARHRRPGSSRSTGCVAEDDARRRDGQGRRPHGRGHRATRCATASTRSPRDTVARPRRRGPAPAARRRRRGSSSAPAASAARTTRSARVSCVRSSSTCASSTGARSARAAPDDPEWDRELDGRIRRTPEVRAALERMWPVLTGGELVHDLFSFPALVRSRGRRDR